MPKSKKSLLNKARQCAIAKQATKATH